MAYFKNFDHHMAQLIHLRDMDLADKWAESFDATVTEAELQDTQIRDAAIIFASNIWRSGEEDYLDATPGEYKAQLKGCWERRADLFLKEARSLHPEACDITLNEIEQEVQK